MEYIHITQDFKNALISKKGMLTVQELAKRTDVNRWTMSNVLNGRQPRVKKGTYRKLADFIKED